jgi:hypothetical protein
MNAHFWREVKRVMCLVARRVTLGLDLAGAGGGSTALVERSSARK